MVKASATSDVGRLTKSLKKQASAKEFRRLSNVSTL